jgi:hypothetical protein
MFKRHFQTKKIVGDPVIFDIYVKNDEIVWSAVMYYILH